MNGAEILIKTALNAGIEVCFTNPGTTELALVSAFDAVPGMRPILGLFEGCCTGAADGYGRMTDQPAMTLLHLGPGLSNGIANLHNARRARTPLFNVIGEHASWHRPLDAPLTMDIETLASTVSRWQRTNTSSQTIAKDTVDAIAAALQGQVSTLIVPSDYQWAGCPDQPIIRFQDPTDLIDADSIERAAALLRTDNKVALILAALQPENAIIVNESITSGGAYLPLAVSSPPHTLLMLPGGAIGYGIPCAVGAAIACPLRPVINFQADGSALYTLQALWMQARESLNITTLICSNRSYNILNIEFSRSGITSPGRYAQTLTDLSNPTIDWVQISKGMGVPAVKVDTCEVLSKELKKALNEPGPHLIEMCLG
jgi:thiamine pyrophosphate-dependent acetolactate synthase large subunit-like protein